MSKSVRSVVLKLPPPNLFRERTARFCAVMTALAEGTDADLQRQITPEARAIEAEADEAAARRFGPIERVRGTLAERTLKVTAEWTGHKKAFRDDSAERKAQKLRAAKLASKYEGESTVVARAPAAEWTIDELVRVVDAVRSKLPKFHPDPSTPHPLHPARPLSILPDDRYGDDARRLEWMTLSNHGARKEHVYHLRCHVASGFAVVITLPALPPDAVLLHFIKGVEHYTHWWIQLNSRAVAQVYRAQARLAEIEAQKKVAPAASGRALSKRGTR